MKPENLTRRDYFAAHAPACPAWFEPVDADSEPENYMAAQACQWAWHWADLMIESELRCLPKPNYNVIARPQSDKLRMYASRIQNQIINSLPETISERQSMLLENTISLLAQAAAELDRCVEIG